MVNENYLYELKIGWFIQQRLKRIKEIKLTKWKNKCIQNSVEYLPFCRLPIKLL